MNKHSAPCKPTLRGALQLLRANKFTTPGAAKQAASQVYVNTEGRGKVMSFAPAH